VKQLLLSKPLGRALYQLWWERKYRVSKDDLFLVSYPRSGNTWVRFMLLQARPGFSEDDFSRIQEIIPDMHGPVPWFRCRRANVVKSHLTYWQPFRRVIYLVRDGRAATYSNWSYQKSEGAFAGGFDEFLQHDHWPSSWNLHVTGWLNAPQTKLIVRYEDLVNDTSRELSRILNFIGWMLPETKIEAIVRNSSKERMQEMEKVEKVRLHRVGETEAGGWRKAFEGSRLNLFTDALSPLARQYLCN
jgi:hypothetical protein